jgi:hypothetical protein
MLIGVFSSSFENMQLMIIPDHITRNIQPHERDSIGIPESDSTEPFQDIVNK